MFCSLNTPIGAKSHSESHNNGRSGKHTGSARLGQVFNRCLHWNCVACDRILAQWHRLSCDRNQGAAVRRSD
ncbi:hypothetical protein GDO81_018235 [Engystomops pustulosus]|uniref:Uncharacterized protein n=1 Tax=Engystomops pustulosus TaxID=76066 RepID=A0AAV7AAH5_ENGPU|nr:hypothetical protein GDO81_018235 [Engystomops pustulosus]